ncbi:phosphotransacetylase family protein [Synechococcus sp. PCC 6312]|uniref:phosphotransacetylase family protein n=1 Tax=Synechococcus sp. (strain ATCC 27167 / PCC 6312) TaxID=195253 RepID=UPI00029EFDBD|nr:phosphotransacetylase family protein [Synechococcus sp. PCC 6312]AFY59995.1 protein with phosphotransacetylase BioD-like N-terminal domain [Synechococcus sp. PCC 6312]
MPHHLIIGSITPYSGKSATVLGLAQQLQKRKLPIAFGKPIGTELGESGLDADVAFIQTTLGLSNQQIRPSILTLTPDLITQRLRGLDIHNYADKLSAYQELGNLDELVLLEGPSTLEEGRLFGLSLREMAMALPAKILLIARYLSPQVVESLLLAQSELGEHLLGILINDIAPNYWESATLAKEFLEAQGMPVLGLLPRNQLLRSVSVQELVRQLGAEVLCRGDRLDLLVEELSIGAMNVSAALKYFRKGNNMAVITGGDRTDIQWAALETSTHCLILTGHLPPTPALMARAEELEIPILSVDLDTLTAVEIVDRAFGQVRLHEAVKVDCVYQLMAKHFQTERLLSALQLPLPA